MENSFLNKNLKKIIKKENQIIQPVVAKEADSFKMVENSENEFFTVIISFEYLLKPVISDAI